MRAMLLGVFAFGLCATAAMAADDILASRYGNTTDSVDSQGIHTKVWYNADHTFKASVQGVAVAGTWKLDGGIVCLTYVNPPANMPTTLPNPTCLPVVAHKIGDTWSTGEGAMKRTITLKAGVQ